METKPRKIADALSLILHRVVAALLPARRRTELLNDFYGAYVSTRQFVQDAADTVPYIVADEVRQTSSAKLLAAQCGVLYVAFIGASASLPIIPATIVLAVATSVLVLRDAYFRPTLGSADTAIADAVVIATFVFASQVLLSIAVPSLVLPGRVLLRGLTIGLLMVVTLRAAYGARYGKDRKEESRLAYRWTWRMNAVWLAGVVAEMLTRGEVVERSEFILLMMPTAVFGLCSWFEKRGFTPEEPEYSPLSYSTSRVLKKEQQSPSELFFLVLFIFASSMIVGNWISSVTSTRVDVHWMRTWASFIVFLGTFVVVVHTLRYSSEKA